MAANHFGEIFRFTTWGESHGKAIGAVVDGIPANIHLTESYIQEFLDKRKPNKNKFTSSRKEPDKVKILSGLFNSKTTGTPISLIIHNRDHKPQDYNNLLNTLRPGHANYVYLQKYGIFDPFGGGRASARETAMRVAVGAIASKIIERTSSSIQIKACLAQIGIHKIKDEFINWKEVDNNDLFCPNKNMYKTWKEYLQNIYEEGDSIGALVEIHITGVPPGLGEPIYKKLNAAIANAVMSINAVKSVEIGAGIKSASMKGSEYTDEMYYHNNKVKFYSNNAGGILGGISTGQTIIVRFAVKPASSIKKNFRTIDINNNYTLLSVKGRHDTCIGIRVVPVAKAMLACVIADYLLIYNAIKHKK